MSDYHIEELETAADLRGHLVKLEAERALALDTGVSEIGPYIAELDEEIEYFRAIYVAYAVTEIATLRAEISGPLEG